VRYWSPYLCKQPNALQTEQSFGLSGLRPIQPRFSTIEAGLPRTLASSHHRIAHQLLNLQPYILYYKPSLKDKWTYTKPCSTDKHNSFSNSQRKKKFYATTYVAKANTKPSPGPGVTPEGQCRPGTGPTPRTSQKERTLATQGCPWGSRRSYLKQILARLSILILSKAFPGLGIL
jgi:hypothetical protein